MENESFYETHGKEVCGGGSGAGAGGGTGGAAGRGIKSGGEMPMPRYPDK